MDSYQNEEYGNGYEMTDNHDATPNEARLEDGAPEQTYEPPRLVRRGRARKLTQQGTDQFGALINVDAITST